MARTGMLFAVDTREIGAFARDLRLVGPASANTMRAAMAESGELVRKSAREKAAFSTGGSTTSVRLGHKGIPSSIQKSFGFQRGVYWFRVRAGGKQAPQAAPLENEGKGHPRHPLYGNKQYWYTNSTPAFMEPALRENTPAILALTESALDEAIAVSIYGGR